jgi:hypothetical protein
VETSVVRHHNFNAIPAPDKHLLRDTGDADAGSDSFPTVQQANFYKTNIGVEAIFNF